MSTYSFNVCHKSQILYLLELAHEQINKILNEFIVLLKLYWTEARKYHVKLLEIHKILQPLQYGSNTFQKMINKFQYPRMIKFHKDGIKDIFRNLKEIQKEIQMLVTYLIDDIAKCKIMIGRNLKLLHRINNETREGKSSLEWCMANLDNFINDFKYLEVLENNRKEAIEERETLKK